jgi:energy-coupling factor transport system substrate-specific component
MLLPKELPPKWEPLIYMGIAALHGLLYGTLYAPYQALVFGLSFQGMLAWIVAGLPYDVIHAAGNFAAGFLVLPLTGLLRTLSKQL